MKLLNYIKVCQTKSTKILKDTSSATQNSFYFIRSEKTPPTFPKKMTTLAYKLKRTLFAPSQETLKSLLYVTKSGKRSKEYQGSYLCLTSEF